MIEFTCKRCGVAERLVQACVGFRDSARLPSRWRLMATEFGGPVDSFCPICVEDHLYVLDAQAKAAFPNPDPRKVIFLDFDGVLNNTEFLTRKYQDESTHESLDPKNVTVLNEIVTRTRAVVVVSSTWRVGRYLYELREILRRNGFTGLVVDRTERDAGRSRGVEIKAWLDSCPESRRPTHFVIVDDDSCMEPLEEKLVRINPEVGLVPSDVDVILRHLEN